MKYARLKLSAPVGPRKEMTREEITQLIGELCQTILQRCGPLDAVCVSFGVVKVLGELVRQCHGDQLASKILNDAMEAMEMTVTVTDVPPGDAAPVNSPGGSDNKDPFSFEQEDRCPPKK